VDGKNYVEIPKFWDEIWDNPQGKEMTKGAGKMGFLGIWAELDEEYACEIWIPIKKM
jgi:predicted transcriptional regulator YdeE